MKTSPLFRIVPRRLLAGLSLTAVALTPVLAGDIVFSSYRSGNQDIWKMHADGSGLRRLTTDPADEAGVPSPDGRLIAYGRRSGATVEIRVMNTEGLDDHLVRAYNANVGAWLHGWLPDGSALLIEIKPPGDVCHGKVFALPLSGLAERLFLDPAIVGHGIVGTLSFSGDGSRIAWCSQPGCWSPDTEVFVAGLVGGEIDSSSILQLTSNGTFDSGPVLSPDGAKLAFSRSANPQGYDAPFEVWTRNADGSGGETRIVDASALHEAYTSAWSPGDTILLAAVQSAGGGELKLWSVNPDGSGLAALTSGPAEDRYPFWLPASSVGLAVFFQSDRAGNSDLWRMNEDGSGLSRLTTDPAGDFSPCPSPDGRLVAYWRRTASEAEVRVMNADGTEDRLLRSCPLGELGIVYGWWPDGSAVLVDQQTPGEVCFNRVDAVSLAGGSPRVFLDPAIVGHGYVASLSFSRDGTKVVWSSQPGCWAPDTEIFLAGLVGGDVDTHTIVRLTTNEAFDLGPVFSPDGTKVAFSRSANPLGYDPPFEVWTLNADGSGGESLVVDASTLHEAYTSDWSPAGKILLAAIQSEGVGELKLWSVNPDGTGLAALTAGAGEDRYPRWQAPALQGWEIVFESQRAGTKDVWKMREDGSGLQPLTTDPADESGIPSPDGRLVAYRRPGGGSVEIRLMNANGADDRLLGAYDANLGAWPLAWLPDGSAVLLLLNTPPGDVCHAKVYALPLAGGGERLFLDPAMVGQGFAGTVSFSRDGSRIAWCAQGGCWSPDTELYVASLSSGEIDPASIVQVTSNGTFDYGPVFSPDGTKLAFSRSANPQGYDAPFEVWTLNSDGSGGETRIVSASQLYDAYVTDWTPGGEILLSALQFDTSPAYNLWTVTGAGLGLRALTSGSAKDWGARWLPVPAAVVAGPVSRNVSPGQPVTFCLQAAGTGPLSYQWQLDGVDIPWANGPCLTIPAAGAPNVGSYSVVVSNAYGTVTSAVARLALLDLKMFAGVILHGAVGSQYRVEYTTSLNPPITWTALTNVTLTASPTVFIDYDSPSSANRFYQAVPLP